MKKKEDVFYLIRSNILPESILKTVEAKKLLESGKADTVFEAVEKVGLSRSAYYKYKDGIFPFNAMMREKIITISMNLEHRSGVLSKVLGYIAQSGGNILTIHQTIPLQGSANVAMSIDTASMDLSTTDFLEGLETIDGVSKAIIVGRG
ncbi:ACT domain-containing protein [Microaerobacter geothermalis]|uniref:ACT domain-containing protein n=1 Tax=Microaerobacter geothermalis TaxID=674972 RepID=UPI001F3B8397|nr:ACT domain-containing protein [Microaerobacter geothermalis]MCF6092721.1 ACT domain-containing protein [Microaerobacter geothermalis]